MATLMERDIVHPDIFRALDGMIVFGRTYPKALPPDLVEWYVYVKDCGHSIACLLETTMPLDGPRHGHLVPIPVLTVLRHYRVDGGYIVVDVPYTSSGAKVDHADEEW